MTTTPNSLPELPVLLIALRDIRSIVDKWDRQPFAAIEASVNQERRIIKECLKLAEGFYNQAQQQTSASPDTAGWRLVPVDRVQVALAQIDALKRHLKSVGAHSDYLGYCNDLAATLSAAPQPPKEGG